MLLELALGGELFSLLQKKAPLNPNPNPNPEGGQRAAQVKVFEKREFVSTTWINPISGRL